MSCKNKVKLAENLNTLLKDKKLSLHQLSLNAKINKSSLHNYANGVMPQGLISLIKISDYFDMSLDELIMNPSKSASPQSNKEEKYEITIKKI